jgi:hypothetical protein
VSFRFFTIGLACAGAAGGVLAAMACIPDLPNGSQATTQDGSVSGPEGGKPFCGDGIIDLPGEQCDPGTVDGSAYCTAACKVVCDGGFLWSRNDHCYFDIPPGAVSLNEANGKCTGGAHVVTFASEDELEAVAGAIDAGAFWIGLNFDTTTSGYTSEHSLEPGWEPTCPGCFAHVPDPTQPLPGDGGFCVEGFSDLTSSWQQYSCSGGRRIHVICEREPAGTLQRACVDAGITCIELAWTTGLKRYVYFHNAAPSDGPDGSAEQTCESLGGSLVVLESRDEREQLWKAVGATQSSFWIGLSLGEGGSSWVWDDDASDDAYASPWGARMPREPGGTRAFFFQNGGTPAAVDDTLARNGNGASSFFPFVCQLPP